MSMITGDDLSPVLGARIASLRNAAASLQPSPKLELDLRTRLFAASPEVHSIPPAAGQPTRREPGQFEKWAAWLAWPVSVAMAMAWCSWMIFTNPAIAPDRTEQRVAARTESADRAAGAAATPFLALASFDEFPAGMRSEIVAASLPRATLAEFGLPVSPLRAAEPIHAEFLVGPGGGVLAVRFFDDSGR